MGRPKKERPEGVDLKPWTIREVSNEARNAARIGAKKEGKSLGQWVEASILNSLKKSTNQKTEVSNPADVVDVVKLLSDKIDKLSGEINEINKPWWDKIRGK